MAKIEKQQTEQSPTYTFLSKFKDLNAFVLIFFIIIFSAILTYIIPAGEYDRVKEDGRTTIVSDSFTSSERSPVQFFDIFTSVHQGMVNGSQIIFFVIMVGGAFGILKATGAIDALIHELTKRLATKEYLLIPSLMFIFALGGTLMGLAEETIIYIAIVTPLAISLGFDAFVGFAIVSIGANIGFMAAVMNPFNVGIAQSIAELPTFSGMGLRIAMLFVFYIVAVLYVYRYAKKIKANEQLRFYGHFPKKQLPEKRPASTSIQTKHKWIFTIFILNFILLIFGVMQYGWYITEIAGLFLLFGVIVGLIGRLTANDIVDHFIIGAKEVMSGALIIGFAQAILIIFQEGKIMDPILYYAANFLNETPAYLTSIGMFIVQLFINFLVPSGSGQAALTMPIMTPLADLVGVTRQTAVLAFQLGDGITNSIFPTSGVLIAGLAIAGIPYTKWLKWVWPLILINIAISIVFLLIAYWIDYGPF